MGGAVADSIRRDWIEQEVTEKTEKFSCFRGWKFSRRAPVLLLQLFFWG